MRFDHSLIISERNVNLTFHANNGKQVGRFWYDEKYKEFKFEGDKAKSAMEFVAWCLVAFREQLREHYIERPEEDRHDT